MNYLEYVKGYFSIGTNDGHYVHAYLEDNGSIVDYSFVLPDNKYYHQYTKEELDYYVCNYINRFGDNLNTLDLIAFSVGQGSDIYLSATNKLDFLLFSCNIDDYQVSACYLNIEAGYTYDDYSFLDNYSLITSNGAFNGGNTNRGNYIQDLSSNYFSIFDYTSLYYENGDYIQDVTNIRGENVSLFNAYFYLDGNTGDNIRIGYGAPIGDVGRSEYQRGYGAGSAGGYINGFDNGYRAGQNSTGNVTTTEANAFSYIGSAFGVVSDVLSLEVLPNITLGLCFSIPLVFVLIMTIFKLVRK